MHEDDERGRPGTSCCEVCQRVSHTSDPGWRRYLGVSDDDQVNVVVYCPDCLEELLRAE